MMETISVDAIGAVDSFSSTRAFADQPASPAAQVAKKWGRDGIGWGGAGWDGVDTGPERAGMGVGRDRMGMGRGGDGMEMGRGWREDRMAVGWGWDADRTQMGRRGDVGGMQARQGFDATRHTTRPPATTPASSPASPVSLVSPSPSPPPPPPPSPPPPSAPASTPPTAERPTVTAVTDEAATEKAEADEVVTDETEADEVATDKTLKERAEKDKAKVFDSARSTPSGDQAVSAPDRDQQQTSPLDPLDLLQLDRASPPSDDLKAAAAVAVAGVAALGVDFMAMDGTLGMLGLALATTAVAASANNETAVGRGLLAVGEVATTVLDATIGKKEEGAVAKSTLNATKGDETGELAMEDVKKEEGELETNTLNTTIEGEKAKEKSDTRAVKNIPKWMMGNRKKKQNTATVEEEEKSDEKAVKNVPKWMMGGQKKKERARERKKLTLGEQSKEEGAATQAVKEDTVETQAASPPSPNTTPLRSASPATGGVWSNFGDPSSPRDQPPPPLGKTPLGPPEAVCTTRTSTPSTPQALHHGTTFVIPTRPHGATLTPSCRRGARKEGRTRHRACKGAQTCHRVCKAAHTHHRKLSTCGRQRRGSPH